MTFEKNKLCNRRLKDGNLKNNGTRLKGLANNEIQENGKKFNDEGEKVASVVVEALKFIKTFEKKNRFCNGKFHDDGDSKNNEVEEATKLPMKNQRSILEFRKPGVGSRRFEKRGDIKEKGGENGEFVEPGNQWRLGGNDVKGKGEENEEFVEPGNQWALGGNRKPSIGTQEEVGWGRAVSSFC
ncbi:hypothetical protein HPP92_027035 [Vanilla planifolia]|uniref:Uncharacterized protein n=1 Tax=Vanilla planifolia TaxID=51239 RepID=A0A835PCT2_VANPL|nr:hypothetical protein HPP92_027035 [Vanilla planifolia]